MKENIILTLVKYRISLADEVLMDAKKLYEARGSARSVANRSYYAMFYAVLSLLATIGQASAKHSGVISLFDREFVKSGLFPKEMSKTLHRAFELRQEGDYGEATAAINMEEAQELLGSSEAFIITIQTYLKDKILRG